MSRGSEQQRFRALGQPRAQLALTLFLAIIPAAIAQSQIEQAYSRLPMSFEPNGNGNYLAHGNGYLLLLSPSGGTLCLSGKDKASSSTMTIKVIEGNPTAQAEGLEALPGKSNYLLGNDRNKWRTNVANYAKVRYRGVYPGVDMVYYGNQRQLEYDLVVGAGADPGVIQLAFDGVQSMRIGPEGDLILRVSDGEVRQHKPVVYQESDGSRQAVEGRYVRRGNRSIGFLLGKYDVAKPLVIDPRLNYSTFLGGTLFIGESPKDHGNAVAVDGAGNAYITGWTQSTDFPVKGAFQPSLALQSAFVTKLNASGTALVYSTYLGGSSNGDQGNGIAVDSSGNAYVIGTTYSKTFPVTPGAFQTTLQAGGAAFVTKLNAAGDGLLYSTYLGGTGKGYSQAVGIALDSSGNAYVTGNTGLVASFPITLGAFRTSPSYGFVAKINPAASGPSSLVYSTYLPIQGTFCSGIAVDSSGNAYVTGYANPPGIASSGAFQTSPAGGDDVVVIKLNAAGTGLVYSTYLGGSGADRGYGIAVDAFGNAYVTGSTASTNFPITKGAFQISFPGVSPHVFVTKLNTAGDGLVYSTYLAGDGIISDNEQGNAIAVDYAGNAYVTGFTTSINFPITPDGFRSSVTRSVKAFAAKVSAAGDRLVYSTFLAGDNSDIGYGVAVDALGNAYVTGYSASINFPVTPGAFQTKQQNGVRAFVTAIAADTGVTLTQTGFTFQAVQGGGAPSPKSFRFFNSTARTLNFTVTASTLAGGGWLSASAANGSINSNQPASINVSVNPSGLSPGDYYGQLRIDAPGAPNAPEFLTVVLNVSPSGTNPGPVVEPTGLVFVGLIGATTPAGQSVHITNLTNRASSFTAVGSSAGGTSWFTLSAASGSVLPNQPVDIRVQPNSGLPAGVYRGTLVLQFPQDAATRTVDLLLVVTTVLNPSAVLESGLSARAATATCTATKLLPVFTSLGANFNAPAFWPAAIEVNVLDDCASPMRTGSVVASFSNGDPPLRMASQQDGHWSATWAPVNARTGSLQVTVTAQQPEANLQGTVQAGGTVQDNPGIPALNVAPMVSSGSYLARPSPGELVAVFGGKLADGTASASALPLQTQMQGTQLLFAGQPLPLVFISPGQVNAMVPYLIAPGVTFQLVAQKGNRLSLPQPVTVAAAEPAIFTTDSSGTGQGHIYVYVTAAEQDLAGPARPAKTGDILIIYCAGLGAVVPAIDAGVAVDRLTQTVNPVSVTIAGVPSSVLFAGLAPGFTGLYQVNVMVPPGVFPGSGIPVVLSVAGVSSPPVTMSVQ